MPTTFLPTYNNIHSQWIKSSPNLRFFLIKYSVMSLSEICHNMEVKWIAVIHIDLKWSEVSTGVSHSNLIHDDLQRNAKENSMLSGLRIDPRLRLQLVLVHFSHWFRKRESKRCRDQQQGSRISHRHDCKAMHEVLAIEKVEGLQLASGLRVPERVFFLLFRLPMSLSLSLSAASKPQEHSRAKFTLRGDRFLPEAFVGSDVDSLDMDVCYTLENAGSRMVSCDSPFLLYFMLFSKCPNSKFLSLSLIFCFTSIPPLISKGYDSEDSEMEA